MPDASWPCPSLVPLKMRVPAVLQIARHTAARLHTAIQQETSLGPCSLLLGHANRPGLVSG